MFLTKKEQMDARLNFPSENSIDTSYTVHYQDSGPSDYDFWLEMEGREKCWQQLEESQLRQHKKWKVIISDDMLNVYPTDFKDYDFFSSLIGNYEVYLWQDEKTPWSMAKPVKNTKEFWKMRDSIHPANKKSVEESLANQSISPDDYFILDHEAYFMIKKNTKYLDAISLRGVRISDSKILDQINKSITPSLIKKIMINAPNQLEIEIVLKNFTNLEHVGIIEPSTEWVKQHLEKFNGKEITLHELICENGKLIIPENVELTALNINYPAQLVWFRSSKSPIKKLTF